MLHLASRQSYSRKMTVEQSRIFFALNPDSVTRHRLEAISAGLDAHARSKVPPENYHLTLLFLGSVKRSLLPELLAAAAQIESAPFSLDIDQAGWWPKPKILWLGPTLAPNALHSLAEQLSRQAQAMGLLTTITMLKPHITLLRHVKGPVALPEFEGFSWQVDSFCLMESISQPDGVRYQILENWPLSISA